MTGLARRIGWLVAALACGGGAQAAVAHGHGDARGRTMMLADYRLAPGTADDDERDRFMLPDVADSYEPPREPGRLRIRGRKIKLRVPLD